MSYNATTAGYKLAIAKKIILIISSNSDFFLTILAFFSELWDINWQLWIIKSNFEGGEHVFRIASLYLNADLIICNCVKIVRYNLVILRKQTDYFS